MTRCGDAAVLGRARYQTRKSHLHIVQSARTQDALSITSPLTLHWAQWAEQKSD